MPTINKQLLKKLITSPTAKTIEGASIGGILGKILADYENKHIYTQEPTKNVSSLMGPSSGALVGAVLGNPKLRKGHLGIALAALVGLTGMKQSALQALDVFDRYTSTQESLAEKTKDITKNQLETAIVNKDIADAANKISQKWQDISKIALPSAAGLATALTGLYAYNTFKDKNTPLNIKVENKTPGRAKDSMYLEIPSEKISDKFYNTFSRELLFKDDREKYLEAKDKENKGMNLTSKEKKILDKFEKVASTTDVSFSNDYNLDKDLDKDLKKELDAKRKLLFQKRLDLDYKNALKNLREEEIKSSIPSDYNNSSISPDYYNLSNFHKRHKMPKYQNPTVGFLKDDIYGLTRAIKENEPELSQEDKALLFEHIKDRNTPLVQKIISMLLPMVQSLGVPSSSANPRE